MSPLLLTFYGDDFTGSTDALEQLTLAGLRTVLFMAPPTRKQLAEFKGLQAVGVAGLTRSMKPDAMEQTLKPALRKLKALGARHVHYKVCSTFDSSPRVGSIGRAIDVGVEIFRSPFIPLLVAAPSLGRYCIFGNLFARYGIGSTGAIHRLDRHPSISRHPVTPMTEADLSLHLARQTRKRIALFDIARVALPPRQARAALKKLLVGKPDVVLFDALYQEQLKLIGGLIDDFAGGKQPLFSVGSSGIEMALGAHWRKRGVQGRPGPAPLSDPVPQVLVASGSCSPVTSSQITWALKRGFSEVSLDPLRLSSRTHAETAIQLACKTATTFLRCGRSVIVHTACGGPSKRIATELGSNSATVLGSALGEVLRRILDQHAVHRICLAGGDTSSHAAGALGIEALDMIAPLTPGAPLCRAHAPNSPVDGREIVFKGGQVGSEDYFGSVLKGKQ